MCLFSGLSDLRSILQGGVTSEESRIFSCRWSPPGWLLDEYLRACRHKWNKSNIQLQKSVYSGFCVSCCGIWAQRPFKPTLSLPIFNIWLIFLITYVWGVGEINNGSLSQSVLTELSHDITAVGLELFVSPLAYDIVAEVLAILTAVC